MRALNLNLVRAFLIVLALLGVACGSDQSQDLADGTSEPMSDAGAGQNPINPARQPSLGSSGPGYYPSAVGGVPDLGSDTQVVDVGNPQGTGPKAKLRFRIADAPIDGVDAFVLRIEKIYAVSTSRGEAVLTKDYGGMPVPVDLLQYAQGNSFELADVEIQADSYDHIVVKMADQDAAFVVSGGMTSQVQLNNLDLGQGLVFSNAIVAELQFELLEDQETDLTMHVPLWKKLKDQGGSLSLDPEQELYNTGSVGGIRIVDLPLGILTICATPSSEAPPPWLPIPIIGGLLPSIHTGNSDCLTSSARSLALGDIYLGHLPPADYRLDLYLTTSLYISLPNLLGIVAGQDQILDLSWIILP